MYLPTHFQEPRLQVLHESIREHPLGALVTLGADGLTAEHIPFEIDPEPAPFGTLRAHVAMANRVWRNFSLDWDALVIFQGPQCYISPSWYPSKTLTGEVVPTYNYLVAHASGPIKIIHDRAWLRDLVTRLTAHFENHRPKPWRLEDAPEAFVEKQLAAIVGIEIALKSLTGKWKVSQNRPVGDREAVARELRSRGDSDAVTIARWVEEKSKR